jgi:CubicO group peptidase (beta-lactamase class C family)
MYSMTRRSALRRANGSRSEARQCRRIRRSDTTIWLGFSIPRRCSPAHQLAVYICREVSTLRFLLQLLIATLTVVVVSASLFAQQLWVTRLDGTKISPSQIDATVTRLMEAAHVTGVGIAVWDNDKVVYLKTYGERNTEKHLPLTPDSVMTAASLAKPAFATMVVQLVHEHVIELDKPVYKYPPKPLPEYPAYKDLADDPRYKQITMRMLLDHTSGFPNWRRFTDDKKLRIYFPPGSKFAYSGEGIALAQMVVETVTKKTVTELMKERIFQPLSLNHTSMVWEPRFEHDYANGYDEHGKSLGPERRRKGDAAGSMQTTLRDYSRFVQSVLNDTIPDKHDRELMLSPQIQITSKHEFPTLSTETTTENRAIRLSYGLGWGLFWTPYGKAFFKEGHDEGWRHYVVCFDQPKAGMLIMTNSSNGEDIYDGLLRTVLGDTFTPLEWEGFKASSLN